MDADPVPRSASFTEADRALRQERYEEAGKLLSMLERSPATDWALGVALHGQGLHDEALAVLRPARRALTNGADRWRCAIDIAIAHNKRAKPRWAERILRLCQYALAVCGDKTDQLKCALYLAVTEARRGRARAFVAAHDRLRDALEASAVPELQAIAWTTRAACLLSLLRFDEARMAAHAGRDIAIAHTLALRHALAEFQLLCIAYEQGGAGDLREAAARAQMLCEASGSRLLHIDILTLRACIAYTEGNLSAALEFTRAAQRGYSDVGYRAGVALCAVNEGFLLRHQGEFAKALTAYATAERINTEIDDALGLAKTLFFYGWLQTDLGFFDQAVLQLSTAHDIYERNAVWIGAMQCCALLAIAAPDDAYAWLSRAEAHAARGGESVHMAEVDRLLGEFHAAHGNTTRADDYLARAEARFDALGFTLNRAVCTLPRLAIALENGAQSESVIGAQAATLRLAIDGVLDLEVQAEIILAECAIRAGTLDAAYMRLGEAARRVALLHTRLVDPVLSGHVATRYAHVCARALALAAQRDDAPLALQFAAMRRMAVARRTEARRTATSNTHDDNDVHDALTQAALRLRLAQSHILQSALPYAAQPVEALRAQVRALDAAHRAHEARALARIPGDELPAFAPKSAALGNADWRAALNAHFGSRWTVLSIEPLQPVESAWLLLHATPTTVRLRMLRHSPVTRHLLRMVDTADSDARTVLYSDASPNGALLRTLAEWLGVDEWLSNGQSGLGEHPGEPVLLLADCATFAGIPFGALPDARGRALASRATLIYAPDVWSFSQLPASQPAAANTLGRVFLVAPQHFGGRHAPLPATRHEIDLVQRLWPDATCLVGGDATCSALRALAATGALQSFDVLIFATHACYFPDHPRLTGLALADGEISVDELSRWQLDARLAFVGACESSRATAVGGENRLGIERALLHAGVHAVVSAAWEVDDALASAFAASLLLAYHAVGETTHSFQRALRAHMTSASIAQWAAWRLTTSRP